MIDLKKIYIFEKNSVIKRLYSKYRLLFIKINKSSAKNLVIDILKLLPKKYLIDLKVIINLDNNSGYKEIFYRRPPVKTIYINNKEIFSERISIYGELYNQIKDSKNLYWIAETSNLYKLDDKNLFYGMRTLIHTIFHEVGHHVSDNNLDSKFKKLKDVKTKTMISYKEYLDDRYKDNKNLENLFKKRRLDEEMFAEKFRLYWTKKIGI